MDSVLLSANVEGVEAAVEFVNPRRRLSGRRVLRSAGARSRVQAFSEDEKTLLQRLLSRPMQARRWRTLVAQAGAESHDLLLQVVRKLLVCGWVEVVEKRDRRGWMPSELRVTCGDSLRHAAGLPDLRTREARLLSLRMYVPRSPVTARLKSSLSDASARMELRRSAWLPEIDAWLTAARTGTLRDFAYALTGKTKGLTAADVAYLRIHGVLDACSLIPHAFQVLVAGHFALAGPWQEGLEWRIGPFPGPAALGEDTLVGDVRLRPDTWLVIENRTVFDRAARIASRCGIVWAPGYVPAAWLEFIGRLLDRIPASGIVLCDPDPAGVELALRAIRPWRDRGLVWSAAGMSDEDMQGLPRQMPLSHWDLQTLSRIESEVADTPLHQTVQMLAARKSKGEQEPIWSEAKLRQLMRSLENSNGTTSWSSSE